ncbi:hypothetical protein [Shewanella sp. OMA3-2]|uniref:hypothetical protein n=1 Tax=Shewanella sp. OMA3-2 TaxID=2908650 RepID=UPI001F158523|nr:hypothetical protein [Shewanella sp. OMA3-2]UJF20597.1 hypothetical protein L0B17_10275 [Shewanella sp. OMA3-2]
MNNKPPTPPLDTALVIHAKISAENLDHTKSTRVYLSCCANPRFIPLFAAITHLY